MTAAPTRPAGTWSENVHFGLVELDLLAAHAGVRFPFPLRVPEFGRIDAEREVLLAAAGVTLRARNLAGRRGPIGVAAQLVTALREHRGTVDLVLAGEGWAGGVVAMVYQTWAMICWQPLAGTHAQAGVRVRRVAQTTLADELIDMVPDVAPAQAMPITLPPDGRDPADPGVLDDLRMLLPERTGTGQLGATRRGADEPIRFATELSWLDGPHGRVRVGRAADGWLSVNPLRRGDIRLAVDDLARLVRREHDGT